MHPTEIRDVLKTFKIIVDSREQPNERALKRYKAFGCSWERQKLDYGDYSAAVYDPDKGCDVYFDNLFVVERKMSIDELCQCYTHDRDRFVREFERADRDGAKVYLLVEDATWERFYAGKYRSRMQPQSLIGSTLAWLARYKCQVVFCRQETSGKLIHDILYREVREWLERKCEDGS